MGDSDLDREVRLGFFNDMVLAVAAPALVFNVVVLLVPLAICHSILGLLIAQSKPFWLATSAVIWAIFGAGFYGLWVVGWNPLAGTGPSPELIVLGCQTVLLPGIVGALFGAPGERSLLADYVKKYGEIEP